jgi:hypothetical protein
MLDASNVAPTGGGNNPILAVVARKISRGTLGVPDRSNGATVPCA